MPFSVAAAAAAHKLLQAQPLDALQARCCHTPADLDDLEDYRRFLALKVAAQDWYASILSPPSSVDRIWHAHLLDTLGYEDEAREGY